MALEQTLYDIESQSKRKDRASDLKRYLVTDLEIIEKKSIKAQKELKEMRDEKSSNLVKALESSWRPISELPEHITFRCIIKFKEFGLDGTNNNHISTGYWWHLEKYFSIDNNEMTGLEPEYFLPLYNNFL